MNKTRLAISRTVSSAVPNIGVHVGWIHVAADQISLGRAGSVEVSTTITTVSGSRVTNAGINIVGGRRVAVGIGRCSVTGSIGRSGVAGRVGGVARSIRRPRVARSRIGAVSIVHVTIGGLVLYASLVAMSEIRSLYQLL